MCVTRRDRIRFQVPWQPAQCTRGHKCSLEHLWLRSIKRGRVSRELKNDDDENHIGDGSGVTSHPGTIVGDGGSSNNGSSGRGRENSGARPSLSIAPIAAATPFRFLHLPPEIRTEIYIAAFSYNARVDKHGTTSHVADGLLSVSHQVRREALELASIRYSFLEFDPDAENAAIGILASRLRGAREGGRTTRAGHVLAAALIIDSAKGSEARSLDAQKNAFHISIAEITDMPMDNWPATSAAAVDWIRLCDELPNMDTTIVYFTAGDTTFSRSELWNRDRAAATNNNNNQSNNAAEAAMYPLRESDDFIARLPAWKDDVLAGDWVRQPPHETCFETARIMAHLICNRSWIPWTSGHLRFILPVLQTPLYGACRAYHRDWRHHAIMAHAIMAHDWERTRPRRVHMLGI